MFAHKASLILYGGRDTVGNLLTDVWHLDTTTKTWTQLPDAPMSTHNVTLSDSVLYLVSGREGAETVGGDVHFLQLTPSADEAYIWNTVPFPVSPEQPGPRPRTGGGLLPVTTGYGRQYLLCLFGAHAPPIASGIEAEQSSAITPAEGFTPPQLWSDMWTYQLPSSNPELKATTNIYEAIKPAKIKDAIRGVLGVDSGKHSWAEVDVLPPTDLDAPAGKVHPGPRSYFASDVMQDGHSVMLWGGFNPKGEREGDGWIIKIDAGLLS